MQRGTEWYWQLLEHTSSWIIVVGQQSCRNNGKHIQTPSNPMLCNSLRHPVTQLFFFLHFLIALQTPDISIIFYNPVPGCQEPTTDISFTQEAFKVKKNIQAYVVGCQTNT